MAQGRRVFGPVEAVVFAVGAVAGRHHSLVEL